MDMMEKLRALDLHYADVQARLGAPETYGDPALVGRLNKEQKELEEALKYLDEILAMQQEDEKGIWKNWYRGDKKIGIRKLMEDTRCLKEGII